MERVRSMNYISLFSSSGVGCFGFKQEGFECIATSELIERRLNVQRVNNKVKYPDGYILGDITRDEVKSNLFSAVEHYKKIENISDVDAIIFTAPCQGMSVANHKKNDGTIEKNSLVVEALEIVKRIHPKFFISENVRSFMNTKCIDHNKKKKISESFQDWLGESYSYESRVINFKDYGANSSRTRTVVIGVRNDLASIILPSSLYPSMEKSKSLKEVIGQLPSLTEMGEIYPTDIYHNFKSYREDMREWIHDVKPGHSAFENKEIYKQPHRIINGQLVPNVQKNGGKYTRQRWENVAPCIHTRNDIMASQNTVHPVDDRVFSIRELMLMMNIPSNFKWTEDSEEKLNNLSISEKKVYLKRNEMNIRQSIGEAVPTIIIQKIAKNIKVALNEAKRAKDKKNYKNLQHSA